jgi:FkbM family methyltransferase
MNVQHLTSVLRFIWQHPANRKYRFFSVVRGVAWQVYKRVTGNYFDINVFGGMRLRCYPDSTSASLALYCHGRPDYHEMGFMQHYLRKGEGFIDVGANIGVYTLLAACLVERVGRVDSFEPGAKAFVRLQENVSLNDLTQVHLHPMAVGDTTGTIRFSCEQDTMNQISLDGNGSITVEVQIDTLDNALAGQHYTMGKMDIEGAELMALRGAQRMLVDHNPPVWLLELNGALHTYGFSEQEFSDWLADHEYDLALYDADSRTLNFKSKPWLESGNVLAIQRKMKEYVLKRCQEF